MTDFINQLTSDEANLLLYKLGLEDLSSELTGIFAFTFINFIFLVGIVFYLVWKEDAAYRKKNKKEVSDG